MLGLSEKLKKDAANRKSNDNNNNSSAAAAGGGGGGGVNKKISIRDRLLIKEVHELQQTLPTSCTISWDDVDKLHDINLIIKPDEGYWKDGQFSFHIYVTEEYNMAPPLVKCKTKIWHPNINEDGAVCLSLLRQSPFDDLGWAPTRHIKDVIWGLNNLFTDLLNFDEPLNNEAASQFKIDPDSFERKVKSYMKDYCHRQEQQSGGGGGGGGSSSSSKSSKR